MNVLRLEILFSGPAPEDEFERARLLAAPAVAAAFDALSAALNESGLSLSRQVRVVRGNENHRKPKAKKAAEVVRAA